MPARAEPAQPRVVEARRRALTLASGLTDFGSADPAPSPEPFIRGRSARTPSGSSRLHRDLQSPCRPVGAGRLVHWRDPMAKKISGYVKLQVPAGAANPSPADRPRARSARPQHHGILQGLQREDRADRKGHPDPGDHHRVSGPLLHLRDEAAAGVVLPQEGRRSSTRARRPPARATRLAASRATRSARSPRRRWPISTATASKPPWP